MSVAKLIRRKNIWGKCSTVEAWVNLKNKNMRKIKLVIQRDLTLCEKRMFLFAKSCLVCRSRYNLSACEHCLSVYVCPEHKLPTQHSCAELLLSLKLDRYHTYHIDDNEKIPVKYMTLDKDAVCDMDAFVRLYLEEKGRECMQNFCNFRNCIYTDTFTGPLTLIYGMQRAELFHELQKKKSLIVHIIAQEDTISQRDLLGWEIVLHKMNFNKKVLLVEVIGPNVQENVNVHKLCYACRGKSNVYLSKAYTTSYHKHTNYQFYKPPDVIIAFDVELWNEKTMMDIIIAIQRQNCPLFLTATTDIKENDNIIVIQEALESRVNPVVRGENKFASLRPHKDEDSDAVFYRNRYLTVFRNLRASSDSAQTSSSTSDVTI